MLPYLKYAAGAPELTSPFFATLGFINLQISFYYSVLLILFLQEPDMSNRTWTVSIIVLTNEVII